MNTLYPDRQQSPIRVKQLRTIAGLTYRQIGDWEAKGVIPKTHGASGQWRSFTPSQTFGLAVLAEVRRRLGAPLESLRWLGSVLMAEGAKHLYQAIGKISVDGVPVLIVTDLKKVLHVVSSIELGEALVAGKFPVNGAETLVTVKVNEMARHIVKLAGLSMDLGEHGQGYGWAAARHAKSPEEEKILTLLRSVQFNKIEVDLANGQVRMVTAEQTIPQPALQDIIKLTAGAGFQTVEVVQHDGATVRGRRRIKIKPAELRVGLGTRR